MDQTKEKLPYSSPKLIVHGTVAEMTKAPPFNGGDWPGNGKVSPPFDGSEDNIFPFPPGRR